MINSRDKNTWLWNIWPKNKNIPCDTNFTILTYCHSHSVTLDFTSQTQYLYTLHISNVNHHILKILGFRIEYTIWNTYFRQQACVEIHMKQAHVVVRCKFHFYTSHEARSQLPCVGFCKANNISIQIMHKLF